MAIDWLEDILGIRTPDDHDHIHLYEFDVHGTHPHEIPGAVSATLHHPKVPGLVVVNARTQAHFDSHRQSTSISMTPVPRRPNPIFLDTAVVEAIEAVAGETLDYLLHEARVDPIEDGDAAELLLGDVLDAHADAVVEHTVAKLRQALPGLSEEDAAACVVAKLSELASSLVPVEGDGADSAAGNWTVVTKIGLHDDDTHDLAFSIRDIGTINKNEEKLWGSFYSLGGVNCTVQTIAKSASWKLGYSAQYEKWEAGKKEAAGTWVKTLMATTVKRAYLTAGNNTYMSAKSSQPQYWYVDASTIVDGTTVSLVGEFNVTT